MSLMQTVIDMITERRGATVDDLIPHLPHHTRKQVMSAIANARALALIHCLGRGRGIPGAGRAPAIHYPGPKPGSVRQPAASSLVMHIRPPASAWELAHTRQHLGAWPPAFEGGRRYIPLGPWVDPNDNDRRAA